MFLCKSSSNPHGFHRENDDPLPWKHRRAFGPLSNLLGREKGNKTNEEHMGGFDKAELLVLAAVAAILALILFVWIL